MPCLSERPLALLLGFVAEKPPGPCWLPAGLTPAGPRMRVGLLHPAPAITPGLQDLGAALLGPQAHPLVPCHQHPPCCRRSGLFLGLWAGSRRVWCRSCRLAGCHSLRVCRCLQTGTFLLLESRLEAPVTPLLPRQPLPSLRREQQHSLHHPSGTGWGLAASPPSQQRARAPGMPRARRAPGPSPGPHPQPPSVCVRARPPCSRALSSGLCLGSLPPRSAALHALPRAFA